VSQKCHLQLIWQVFMQPVAYPHQLNMLKEAADLPRVSGGTTKRLGKTLGSAASTARGAELQTRQTCHQTPRWTVIFSKNMKYR